MPEEGLNFPRCHHPPIDNESIRTGGKKSILNHLSMLKDLYHWLRICIQTESDATGQLWLIALIKTKILASFHADVLPEVVTHRLSTWSVK